jgi:hypothetical protein
MEIYVACDVCGHRYVLSGDREGRKSKCKSCGVPFEVAPHNFYDPETSEQEEESDDEADDSSTSPVWEVSKKIGHGFAALVTLTMLVWMGSLVFRSPQQVAAQMNPAARIHPQGAAPQVNPPTLQPVTRPPFPQVTPNGPPGFQPSPRPRRTHGVPPVPNFRTGPAPPVVDGSVGWPKSEPDQPRPPK